MTASERLDSKGGPLSNLSQTYFSSLDRIAKVYEPTLRGVGRWNMEVFNLLTRRSQAWLDVPVQLGRCRTPQDVVSAQLKFWQQAAAHYADGAQRLTVAFGACAVPGLNGVRAPRADGAKRDIITFAEPKEEPAPDVAKRTDRRAA